MRREEHEMPDLLEVAFEDSATAEAETRASQPLRAALLRRSREGALRLPSAARGVAITVTSA